MKKILLLFTLLISFLSSSQNKIQKGDISDEQVLIEYAIYFLDDKVTESLEAKKIIQKEFPLFEILDSIPSPENVKGSQVVLTPINNVKEQFPPASLEYLKYSSKGLNDLEKRKLQKSKYVLLLDFVCEKSMLIPTMKKANELVNKLVKKKNAVIYDSGTRETFNKEYWSKNRLVKNNSINISNHITIHFYQKEEYCRAITLGMYKFGLPDLCIENLSCQGGLDISSFLNLTAQTILEKQKIINTGILELNIPDIQNDSLRKDLLNSLQEDAERKGKINIIEGTWEDGDPENRLIEIAFSKDNPQIEHDEILTKIFGSEDKVFMLSHDQELLEASKRAKSKIPMLKKMFSKGLPFNSSLIIKFPFENSLNEREWMWVEITKWDGDNINGLLQNEPAIVKKLKAGQKITKNINDMFDYILNKPDGSQEGNETGAIIMKMQN